MSEKTKRDTTTTTKKAHKEFTRYTNTHALCSNTFNVNKNSPSASLLSSGTAQSPAIVGLLIEQTYDKIIINKRQQQLHRTVCFDFVLLFLSLAPLRSINKLKWAYSFVLLYFFLQLFSVSVWVWVSHFTCWLKISLTHEMEKRRRRRQRNYLLLCVFHLSHFSEFWVAQIAKWNLNSIQLNWRISNVVWITHKYTQRERERGVCKVRNMFELQRASCL